jgi:cyclopropane fatty-acyl-phospholipid synthase-like methyltransferase
METATPTDWFTTWFDTPWYDMLYFGHGHAEANNFIDKLVTHLDVKSGSTILGTGCGSGRYAQYLSQKEFDVTGIDLSEYSVEAAKKLETENLHFYKHDLRQPFWINYFDYAFNLFTSFGYFKNRRENEAAIRTFSQALNRNGKLVIDYLNVHFAEENFVHSTNKSINGYDFHITKWMDEDNFYKKIEVEHDSFTEPHIYNEKIAKYSLGDFTDMLAYQGMQIEDVFGDYQLGSYHVRNTPE